MEFESLRRNRRRARILSLLWLLAMTTAAPVIQATDDPLVMGVFPRRNATETTKLFTPLADHLGEQLGRKVKLVTAKDFDSFWHGVTERRYDIVHYNQYHYVRSARTYQVVAHIEEFGKRTMEGALYVRKDSGITHLTQLRGRTILFGGGEDAMIAYIVPRYLMQQAGLRKEDFKSVFAVNPPNAVLALFHRQSDAAGAGGDVIGLPVVKNAINTAELTILAESAPLLQLPWAVKRSLPANVRASIQTNLVTLGNSEAGKQVLKSAQLTGMGKAEDKDYDPHRKIVRAVIGTTELAQQ
jgi:phosphonate transport system substrate-binding protein